MECVAKSAGCRASRRESGEQSREQRESLFRTSFSWATSLKVSVAKTRWGNLFVQIRRLSLRDKQKKKVNFEKQLSNHSSSDASSEQSTGVICLTNFAKQISFCEEIFPIRWLTLKRLTIRFTSVSFEEFWSSRSPSTQSCSKYKETIT